MRMYSICDVSVVSLKFLSISTANHKKIVENYALLSTTFAEKIINS
jgi:hypothetical protein